MTTRLVALLAFVVLGLTVLLVLLRRAQRETVPGAPAGHATRAVLEREARGPRADAAAGGQRDVAATLDAASPIVIDPLPLRGRVSDARTGEPIPALELGLLRAGDTTHERVVTDELGRFVTSGEYLPGHFDVEWLDPDAASSDYGPSALEVDTLELEHELALEVGPTYRFDLTPPPGVALESLRAALASRAGRPAAVRNDGDFTPVRAGSLPWVRFHPDQVDGPDARGPWELEVMSSDGLWRGAVRVKAVVGRYPEVVSIDLEGRASVRATVRNGRDEPVEMAWARLEHDDSGTRLERWHLQGGLLNLRGLVPGAWRLDVDADEHPTWSAEIELRAGEEHVRAIVLKDFEPAGSIRGLVTSATGTCTAGGFVGLWGHEGTKSNRRSALEWVEENGRYVHRFAFDDLPAGTYRLELVARASTFEVHPAFVQLVTVPAQGVEIRVLDDVPTADVVFRVRDAESGATVESFGAWWASTTGWAGWRRGIASGEVVVEAWPVGRELLWALRVERRALASGDGTAFKLEGERLVADVSVRAGFGVQFFVRDEQNGELPGIRFAFDGVEVGPTGPRGRLPVSLARRPERIEVLTPGWRLAGGDVDPESGDFDDDNWWALALELARTD